ncbi:MAG: 30S ribosomal protein S6 [Candidatus Blackburnbacteria bacterium]|nr:30S ribosomal protein S6 [Candidatus Blackburnbacteria bacterium]
MRQYELTTVLAGDITEAKQKKFNDKLEKLVTNLGGSIEKTDFWGKKTLSYPVKKNTSGVYYFLNINLPPEQATVLNREVELDEEVLRHLLVVSEGKSQAPNSKIQTKEEKSEVKKKPTKEAKEPKTKKSKK